MDPPPDDLVHRQRTLVPSRTNPSGDPERYTVCGLPVRGGEVVAVVGRGEAAGRRLCPVCWPRR